MTGAEPIALVSIPSTVGYPLTGHIPVVFLTCGEAHGEFSTTDLSSKREIRKDSLLLVPT